MLEGTKQIINDLADDLLSSRGRVQEEAKSLAEVGFPVGFATLGGIVGVLVSTVLFLATPPATHPHEQDVITPSGLILPPNEARANKYLITGASVGAGFGFGYGCCVGRIAQSLARRRQEQQRAMAR
jgi:hypothetical protein